ncbi:MAG TPA: mechanosensitive ion channel domain-containing protein [Acidobacteriota bacterium]|nr:mechanosensitive ion channel domain-containing protein [Acidobacteriota bacterium]
MNDILFSILVIAGAVAVGIVFSLIIFFLIKRSLKFIKVGARVNIKHLKSPLLLLLPAFFVLFSLPLTRFTEGTQGIILHAATLWLIASVGWLFIKIMSVAKDFILSRYDIEAKDNLQARRMHTQIRVISNVITVVIVILTVSFMLLTFSKVREVGVSILASAGVLGIILGFAAQKTLGNIIAGIQIAISQPIRLDDAVVVEGEWGWIEEITLTYVVLRIWDKRRLILPISYFVEKPFQNWTRVSADLLGSVYLYMDYTVPLEEVRKKLTKILEQSQYWDKNVNVLQVTNSTDRTVELRALMSASDSPTAWNLRCEVREKLINFLQKKYPKSLPRARLEVDKRD